MKPETFIRELDKNNFSPLMGVPCSVFKSFLNYISTDNTLEHYICSSEGEAMGLAAGFSLSGRTPIVYMQNDGYGNAINPLSSLQLMYKLPTLMLISWRAQPGLEDAPQHKVMGDTIIELLDAFSIPHKIISELNIESSLREAKDYIERELLPFALIIKKGFFDKFESKKEITNSLNSRLDYFEILHKLIQKNDVLLGTTGFSGRELYQTTEYKTKFYMMGSMGCLPAIGLGIAIENPDKRIFVIDGDGALLMKLGTLSTVGYYSPKNYIHICFDNQEYESTGGQPTASGKMDFSKIAKESGYGKVYSISSTREFEKIIISIDDNLSEPVFLHIKIKSGTIEELGRPKETPTEMRDQLMKALK